MQFPSLGTLPDWAHVSCIAGRFFTTELPGCYGHVDALLWTYALISLRNIGVKLMVHTVGNCQTVFKRDCTILHLYQKYAMVPTALCSCPHLGLSLKI